MIRFVFFNSATVVFAREFHDRAAVKKPALSPSSTRFLRVFSLRALVRRHAGSRKRFAQFGTRFISVATESGNLPMNNVFDSFLRRLLLELIFALLPSKVNIALELPSRPGSTERKFLPALHKGHRRFFVADGLSFLFTFQLLLLSS